MHTASRMHSGSVQFSALECEEKLSSVFNFCFLQRHIELGEAIAPLREEGVLLIGSGASWHNNGDLDWQNGSTSKKSRVKSIYSI